MSKHAMEPWRTGRSATENDGWIISSEPVDLNEPCREVSPRVRGKANADRIVACVNACAGINPEAVQDLLAACKAVQQIERCGGYIRDTEGMPMLPSDVGMDVTAAIARAEGGAA